MTTRRARAALGAVVALSGVLSGARVEAESTGGATIELSATSADQGDEITVVGRGFDPNHLLNITICGDQATDSSGCAFQGARQAYSDDAGTWSATVTVAMPPGGCPCVVRALDVETGVAPVAAFSVRGTASSSGAAPEPAGAASQPAGGLEVVDAALIEQGSWTAVFGAPTAVTLRLVVRNTSSTDIVPTALSVAAGPVGRTGSLVAAPSLPLVPAGGQVQLDVPFKFDALAHGRQVVEGRIVSEQGSSSFSVPVSLSLWGLWVVVGYLTLQPVLLVLWFVLRRGTRSRRAAD